MEQMEGRPMKGRWVIILVITLAVAAFTLIAAHTCKGVDLTFGFRSGLVDYPQQMFIVKDSVLVPVLDINNQPLYQHNYGGKILGAYAKIDAPIDSMEKWILTGQFNCNMGNPMGVRVDDLSVDVAIKRHF